MHKSQGLTFRHVNIDFTGGVFAGGQAYVALSRCTSLSGISLAQPIRREDVFVRQEIKQFARTYNDTALIGNALKESAADKEYHDAAQAFDRGDFDTFLSAFFRAIHHRYDIEKPAAKRLIRRKLGIINTLRQENIELKKEMSRRETCSNASPPNTPSWARNASASTCPRPPPQTTARLSNYTLTQKRPKEG